MVKRAKPARNRDGRPPEISSYRRKHPEDGRVSANRGLKAPDASEIVRATVRYSNPKFSFLVVGNESVYLDGFILKRDCNLTELALHFVIECTTEPHPNGKGPCVTRILGLV